MCWVLNLMLVINFIFLNQGHPSSAPALWQGRYHRFRFHRPSMSFRAAARDLLRALKVRSPRKPAALFTRKLVLTLAPEFSCLATPLPRPTAGWGHGRAPLRPDQGHRASLGRAAEGRRHNHAFCALGGVRPPCSANCSSRREETPTRVRFQPTHDSAGGRRGRSFLPARPALPRSRRSRVGGNR